MDLHQICTAQICCKHMFTQSKPVANMANTTFATIFTLVCKYGKSIFSSSDISYIYIYIYIYDISLDEKMDLPYLHTSVNMVANVVFTMFATGLLWVNLCL